MQRVSSNSRIIQGIIRLTTILFDLDDTLLYTKMAHFLPAYFKALGEAFIDIATENVLTQQIKYAVDKMAMNQHPGKMLRDIFAENFYKPLATTKEDCMEMLSHFYQVEYPKLKQITNQKPEAVELVKWCQSQGMTMAIATNPVFPDAATRQRIDWAGLDIDDFAFYSSYENFHFTKPNLAYYAEVLGHLGWPDGPIVMVGDNITHDLIPIETMGYPAFWLSSQASNFDRPCGKLTDVRLWLEKLPHTNSSHLSNEFEVQLAVLRSTPAVMDTWINKLPEDSIMHCPQNGEWSTAEVFCHFADMEENIYLPQWEHILKDSNSSLQLKNFYQINNLPTQSCPPPDQSFQKFIRLRLKSIELVEEISKMAYLPKQIDHMIFSGSTIHELVAFSAKHDRLHLAQCANLLNIYKIN